MLNNFLTFSDGAKFALVAKNLVLGNGFISDFSFFGAPLFVANGIPQLVTYLIALSFKIFGINDFAVSFFSYFFYALLIGATFFLGRKLYNKWVGIFSAIAVGFNTDVMNYAKSGASEPLFFFEIVLGLYFLSFKKIWVNILGVLVMIAMYFTRPQAFIYMIGMVLYFLLSRFGIKKGFIYFLGVGVVGLFFLPMTPIWGRGMQSILTYSSSSAVSDSLRGGASSMLTLPDIVKKVFYNIYNFYKLMPDIINPYIFGLFIIGLCKKGLSEFKISVASMFLATLLVTSLSIPFFRYIHPVVPIVYILAIGTLSEIVTNKILFSILVMVFAVGQSLGVIFLDSRFENKTKNIDKPPVYVILSQKLKEETKKDDVIITNLDTWGSWYGERKTVWFPLEPKMIYLLNQNFDVIYLTSYKIDDANYYMGEFWREIFENPQKQKILPEYKFVREIKISASEDYEKQEARAVLLIKK